MSGNHSKNKEKRQLSLKGAKLALIEQQGGSESMVKTVQLLAKEIIIIKKAFRLLYLRLVIVMILVIVAEAC